MTSFTCFGEVLWDMFPDNKKIGGAPLNVALRLNAFGNDISIISAVGNDILGEKLIAYLKENKINSSNIQLKDNYQTGQVNVTLDSKGSASYEIKSPTAWDNIEINKQNLEQVRQSDVFIYGSLVCRNEVSKSTLFKLLKVAKFKVFDVNLRPPFFSFELIFELMHSADFIKFNDEELELILKELNQNFTSIEDKMTYISYTFNASHVCVTRGDKGAILLSNSNFYESLGFRVNVVDTVGAGDSFLATLLYKIINEKASNKAIDYACAVGAIVAASEGANPKILDEDIKLIMNN
ncbi:carbohydrate kinase [Mesoflavibacter sp. CH_XMU1404-2]|uniref:carbohydrate kinase family protein n=1 Tax=Mesoflavibacter sp. CH_XMU1404-2 TaxID=3107766 RepID=UPI00300B00ED